MRTFGLIGEKLEHSFSPRYFSNKFTLENIENSEYKIFELANIENFKTLIGKEKSLAGLNVTMPYKKEIIPYLDELDKMAAKVGAVNTIKFSNGALKGFNTDVYGFKRSLAAMLKPAHERALILGTGGASEAVACVFKDLGVEYKFVSRLASESNFSYADLNQYVLKHFKLIVNTTPVGQYPKTEFSPNIPYEYLTPNHLCYDLIYNPEKTLFLEKAESRGAVTLNGQRMLTLQAEKSWQIWNS